MIQKNSVVGPFQCNCRALVCEKTGDALVIDPGDEPQTILRTLVGLERELGKKLNVRALIHTHAHLDHIGATRTVKENLARESERNGGAIPRIFLHGDDEPLYRSLRMQGQLFGMQYEEPLPIDHRLQHEEELRFGEIRLTVIHTPGHSPGGVCLRLHEDSEARIPETVFTGDTLFAGSVGRTDLWGADSDQMFRSIRERILTLDDDTRVCAGHGPDSLIGVEKRENPFLS